MEVTKVGMEWILKEWRQLLLKGPTLGVNRNQYWSWKGPQPSFHAFLPISSKMRDTLNIYLNSLISWGQIYQSDESQVKQIPPQGWNTESKKNMSNCVCISKKRKKRRGGHTAIFQTICLRDNHDEYPYLDPLSSKKEWSGLSNLVCCLHIK